MFKNCRKEDLWIVALELGETVAERRVEEDRKKEVENRLREKELELARLHVGVNSDNERTGEVCNSLDALVKSVRILMVKVPNRPEGKGRIAELRYIAKQLGEKVTDELKIIDLKNLIVNSPNYEEEFVREMLNMIIEKRLKTSMSRVSKYFDLNERYILSTYELETLFKLKKHNSKTLDKGKSKSEIVSLNPCIIKSKKNEVEMPVLKDTEASLDLSFEKYAAPEIFTGEHALIKYIYDDAMTYLPPAEREIECELRHVVSKPVVKQNGLPRPETGNEIPTRRQRRKEAEKSTRLENVQFRLRECVVENGEDFVPSFTGEGTDNGNLVKLIAWEVMEAELRSEESAPLIRETENGASDEASDQEGASMQLIPVRHKISTELYVDRVGPLPIIPGNKYILSDRCMSPRYYESVPMISISQSDIASTPLVEALLQTFRRRGFPKEIQTDEKLGISYPLRPFTFKNTFNYFNRVTPELPREYKRFDLPYLDDVAIFFRKLG
ncbi:uncharacterized protein TNIN_437701 [Trichonephila inaurata madagascariensis]|uniref:Uncharacterized protein n=1 Tax=Trichonephila inaurata madagascariensis TaxID=2747483 RepID=A0A8X7BTE7_9ARAC|nr:uncharacterized protein TNIN_437701 [Trichonephila inaurata madagascariensis]